MSRVTIIMSSSVLKDSSDGLDAVSVLRIKVIIKNVLKQIVQILKKLLVAFYLLKIQKRDGN